MSEAIEKLERAILKLPVEQLVSIHEHLISTIHTKAQAQGLESSFQEEIEQRIEEIDLGTTKGVEAFRTLRKM